MAVRKGKMSSFVSVQIALTLLKRTFVVIVLVLAAIMNGGRAIATERDGAATPARPEGRLATFPEAPVPEPGDCHPGKGWMLTRGPSQPETAARVRQELSHAGIEAAVTAISYGEKDTCGNYRMFGVDFNIEVATREQAGNSNRQELAERIHAKLAGFAKTNLGHVKISFSDGDSIYFQSGSHDRQSQDQRSGDLELLQEITHVDAALPWQDSGIYIKSGTAIDLNVIGGLWTHALGTWDYNRGDGSTYVCADLLPPESCVEPIPEAPQGSLIGKIGDHLFAIGRGTKLTAQQSGNLYLRINDGDNGLDDNDGTLIVEVRESATQEVVYQPKLYVIIYDPLLSNGQTLGEYMNWADHAEMTEDTIELFYKASHGRTFYSLVEMTTITDGWPALIDGYRYTEEHFLSILDGTAAPHSPETVDYNKIVNDPALDICGRANRGEIDEVWIFNGPWFGFWESTLVGPGSYWYNSPPVPGPFTCDRIIPIMGPSPERPDMLGHGEGHRMESTMAYIYGGWQHNSTDHNWERFSLVDALSPNYSYSGCGNIHFPPNGTADYDYGNGSVVDTNCDDFANYPNLGEPLSTVKPINCTAWGCGHYGYMEYWYGHLPSNEGCGPDGFANDWWLYFLNPGLALKPASVCKPPGQIFLPLALWD